MKTAGAPLDVDIIINEMFEDGDAMFVEYSSGPAQFTSRWAGRPRTPQFKWVDGDVHVEVEPHDMWLQKINLSSDLYSDGLPDLPLGALSEEQLALALEVVIKHVNVLQLCYVVYTGASDLTSAQQQASQLSVSDLLDRLNLNQFTFNNFRALLLDGNMTKDRDPKDPKTVNGFDLLAAEEHVWIRTLHTSQRYKDAAVVGQTVSTYDFADFLRMVVSLAAAKYTVEATVAESEELMAVPLHERITNLIEIHIIGSVLAKIREQLEQIEESVTPAVNELLERASELITVTLDTTVFKRTKASRGKETEVDLQHLLKHIKNWGILEQLEEPNKTIPLAWAYAVACNAKEPSPNFRLVEDLTSTPFQRVPLVISESLFPHFLYAILLDVYHATKPAEQKQFEVFIANMLDRCFRESGAIARRDTSAEGGVGVGLFLGGDEEEAEAQGNGEMVVNSRGASQGGLEAIGEDDDAFPPHPEGEEHDPELHGDDHDDEEEGEDAD